MCLSVILHGVLAGLLFYLNNPYIYTFTRISSPFPVSISYHILLIISLPFLPTSRHTIYLALSSGLIMMHMHAFMLLLTRLINYQGLQCLGLLKSLTPQHLPFSFTVTVRRCLSLT